MWNYIQPGVMLCYHGMPFGIGFHLWLCWSGVFKSFKPSFTYEKFKDLPFATKLTIASRILQASHILYVSCRHPSKIQFRQLEHILKSYLWSNFLSIDGREDYQWFRGMYVLYPRMIGVWDLLMLLHKEAILLPNEWCNTLRAKSPSSPNFKDQIQNSMH